MPLLLLLPHSLLGLANFFYRRHDATARSARRTALGTTRRLWRCSFSVQLERFPVDHLRGCPARHARLSPDYFVPTFVGIGEADSKQRSHVGDGAVTDSFGDDPPA